MADNLDDLLDEVEAKFCRTSPSAQLSFQHKSSQDSVRQLRNNTSFQRTSKKHNNDGTENDIEAVLQEILDDDDDDDSQAVGPDTESAAAARIKDSCHQATKKCCPVFLGGSLITYGIGTSISQRACDQLRCLSCDFRIAIFDDHEWDSSCDYLFLRNNMPDRNKLRAKLKRRQGARAYACQCNWFSASTLTELSHIQQLKWVCGQHKA